LVTLISATLPAPRRCTHWQAGAAAPALEQEPKLCAVLIYTKGYTPSSRRVANRRKWLQRENSQVGCARGWGRTEQQPVPGLVGSLLRVDVRTKFCESHQPLGPLLRHEILEKVVPAVVTLAEHRIPVVQASPAPIASLSGTRRSIEIARGCSGYTYVRAVFAALQLPPELSSRSPLDSLVVDREAQRSHEVQRHACGGTRARDGARVACMPAAPPPVSQKPWVRGGGLPNPYPNPSQVAHARFDVSGWAGQAVHVASRGGRPSEVYVLGTHPESEA
jgi:hypothetical protein